MPWRVGEYPLYQYPQRIFWPALTFNGLDAIISSSVIFSFHGNLSHSIPCSIRFLRRSLRFHHNEFRRGWESWRRSSQEEVDLPDYGESNAGGTGETDDDAGWRWTGVYGLCRSTADEPDEHVVLEMNFDAEDEDYDPIIEWFLAMIFGVREED